MSKQTTVEHLVKFPEISGDVNTTSSQDTIAINPTSQGKVMTPKQKADELVLRYLRIDNNTKEWFNSYIAKQCALIAVDEILKAREVSIGGLIIDTAYWEEVKQEIYKL